MLVCKPPQTTQIYNEKVSFSKRLLFSGSVSPSSEGILLYRVFKSKRYKLNCYCAGYLDPTELTWSHLFTDNRTFMNISLIQNSTEFEYNFFPVSLKLKKLIF